MKLSIPEPCHEDWLSMTPNEQGAFCGSCQKNVIDFSTKSLDEIKLFFESRPTNEVPCVRFENKQLEALNFDDFFQRFRRWKWLHRVALVFLFVFGTGLFRLGALSAQVQTPQTEQAPQDTTKKTRQRDSIITSIIPLNVFTPATNPYTDYVQGIPAPNYIHQPVLPPNWTYTVTTVAPKKTKKMVVTPVKAPAKAAPKGKKK